METYLLIGLSAANLILLAVLLALTARTRRDRREADELRRMQEKLDGLRADLLAELRDSRMESSRNVQQAVGNLGAMLVNTQTEANRLLNLSQETLQKSVTGMVKSSDEKMTLFMQQSERQLAEMRATVDEKLQKTLEERIGQSFRLVSERLEQVYKGLGEMQTLAAGVGDLKKVLANVKTRGVLGEIQLGAILEQILSPEQYEANVITKAGSKNFVEFAVKLPGNDEGPVYLPIDAKFPADAYTQLEDAYDSGDPALIEAAGTALERRIKLFAKDIREKYLDPPHTTDFGILFLPFEGLYAEVVRRGLIEPLQRDCHVNIAGPTTMAAILNSLQMGFRTLAIQKRSGEVWQVLGAVKTEFDKFGAVVQAAQQRLEQAGSELDKLVGVRTRQIQRRLSAVTKLPEAQAAALLDGEEEEGPAAE